MSIYKTKHGWRVQVYVDSERVATKSGFVTKRDAERWEAETRQKFASGDGSRAGPSVEFTFNDLLERYKRAHLPTVRETTQARYSLDLKYRIEPFFKYTKLKRIDMSLISKFREQIMRDENLAHGSINNTLDLLRSILNLAVEEYGMLERNPYRLKSLKEPAIRYSWWSKEEDIRRFLETAQTLTPDLYLAFRLALDLGLRAGEVNGLSKDDIDFRGCQIHIHRQWCDDTGQYEPLKDNEVRTLPWDPKSDLGDWLQRAVDRSPHPEALFVTRTGNRMLTNKISFYSYRKVREAAKVPPITFHDLRHTFASWYLIRGGKLSDLKAMLGHSSLAMVQKYAHHSNEHMRPVSFGWQKITQNSHNGLVVKMANTAN